MPINNPELPILLARIYADKFLSYTKNHEDAFWRTIDELKEDCKTYPVLANHLISSLTGQSNTDSSRLERIYNKQALAELISQYGKYYLYSFIGFALRSQLPSDTLFLYLTKAHDKSQLRGRRGEFNFTMKSIQDLSNREPSDNGYGMNGSNTSNYLFYFTANELEGIITKLKTVDEKIKAHDLKMQRPSKPSFFPYAPPPPLSGADSSSSSDDEDCQRSQTLH